MIHILKVNLLPAERLVGLASYVVADLRDFASKLRNLVRLSFPFHLPPMGFRFDPYAS